MKMNSHYIRYSLYRFFRLQIQLTLGLSAIIAVVLDVTAPTGSWGGDNRLAPVAFSAFFTFCVGWVGYWFGFRIVCWLEVRDDQLSWRAGFRSGSLPVHDIRR